ncbi:nucleotidyltransferase domain-containing protein [Candidatus Poribacteria bacterium]|nr:nucleotidyltransferase domain-containing protein [Candidatus Poribacteria bacterium]
MSGQKMSSDELSACRKQLEQLWKSRIVDEGLLHRAWQTAYQVATLLYEEFNATQVVVFGSLTEPMSFTKESDIDIAVSGLSDGADDKARNAIWDLKSGFKIDIINFDRSEGLFRERVKHQAIPIEKGVPPVLWQTLYEHLQRQVFPENPGEIYEMNRKRLTQRINEELTAINETLARIHRGLDSIDVLPIQAREFIENTIATDLGDVYRGIENIFLRIAREVDTHVPTGEEWHKNLLAQMTAQRPERVPVISQNTFLQLEKLLSFRHVVNNIYGEKLIYEKTEPHAKSIDALFANVSQDLGTFTDSLVRHEEDA